MSHWDWKKLRNSYRVQWHGWAKPAITHSCVHVCALHKSQIQLTQEALYLYVYPSVVSPLLCQKRSIFCSTSLALSTACWKGTCREKFIQSTWNKHMHSKWQTHRIGLYKGRDSLSQEGRKWSGYLHAWPTMGTINLCGVVRVCVCVERYNKDSVRSDSH